MKIKHYSGQVLAVILIVIVVAAIIALALISRVQSEMRGVTDERSSDQALSVADTVLTGVTTLPIAEIATIVNEAAESTTLYNLCNGGLTSNYDFWEDGCTIVGTDDVVSFLTAISQTTGDSYFSSLANQVDEELADSCSNSAAALNMSITPMQEGEEIVLPEGQLYSIMLDSAPAAGCGIEVKAGATHANVQTGLITRGLYFNSSTGYKPYELTDINGYCLFNCASSTDWQGVNPTPPLNNGWINTLTNGATINVPAATGTYSLDEFRLLGVKGDVTVSYRTNPNACVKLKQAMRIRVTSNCGGNSQGKEIFIPRENWAPAIFDYVIYNGEGSLQYDPI